MAECRLEKAVLELGRRVTKWVPSVFNGERRGKSAVNSGDVMELVRSGARFELDGAEKIDLGPDRASSITPVRFTADFAMSISSSSFCIFSSWNNRGSPPDAGLSSSDEVFRLQQQLVRLSFSLQDLFTAIHFSFPRTSPPLQKTHGRPTSSASEP